MADKNSKYMVAMAILAVVAIISIDILLVPRTSITATTTATTSTQPYPNPTTSTSPLLASTSTIPKPGGTRIAHVIIIVLENSEYNSVINRFNAPYENLLANKYASATDYFAVAHPSEPNYIAMIAGSTLNITNDNSVTRNQRSATNIADLFKTKNVSWKSYQESMPVPCDRNDSANGLYVTKHNPFVYMTDITDNLTYCQDHVVNLDQLYLDLSANQLPQYAFIAPNINDDGHNTNVTYSDSWLSNFVPKLLNAASFNTSMIIITYDEGTTNLNGGGHIATIIIGPPSIIKSGFKSDNLYTHYSLLATIESIYGVGNLGRNDATAGVMNDMLINPVSSDNP